MKQIVAVDSSYFGCYVRLSDGGRVQLLGPRLPERWLVTVDPPRKIPQSSAGMPELSPAHWRGTQLIDFLDAHGAEQHMGTVRDRYVADSFAVFAQDGATRLRAWIAAALELDGGERTAAATGLMARVRRYAAILHAEGSTVLEELRRQPDVEQLIALDNAVVRWSATPIPPPDRGRLVKQTRVLADVAAPGMSAPWHRWMWHLARATSCAELVAVVDAVIADADRRCLAIKVKKKQATAEREEARRLAGTLPATTVHQLEMTPPQRDLFSTTLRDAEVFHFVVFHALTVAASAISLANSGEGQPLDEANLGAMRAVAELALDVLGAT